MAVALDRETAGSRGSLAGPLSITHTVTGGASVRGVVTRVAKLGTSDTITGVTYGGVAMSRVLMAQDAVDEAGVSWLYFLGSSVPQGNQTCEISYTGTETYHAVVASITGDTNTEVVDSGSLEGDQADPQIALDSLARTALRFSVLFSGHNAITSLTVLAGCTRFYGPDFGFQVASFVVENTPSAGSFTIGDTATIEDVAMVAAAITEVADAGGGSTPPGGSPVFLIRRCQPQRGSTTGGGGGTTGGDTGGGGGGGGTKGGGKGGGKK